MTEEQTRKHPTRSCLVLYGTETGNAQDVAYEVNQCLERLHIATSTRELDATPLQQLLAYDLVTIVISTTGQGDFPSNANRFWASLRRKKLGATSLHGVTYGLVGLCDSSYPKFNLAARKLNKRLLQLGASTLVEPCEAEEQGEEGTEGAFLAWLPSFQEEVLRRFPLKDGQVPIPPNQRLPSRWNLVESSANPKANLRNGHSNGAPLVPSKSLTSGIAFHATLETNTRVTPKDHWQDVRLLRLKADQAVPYMPGDALAIRPENSSEDVEQIISILGWQDIADIHLRIRANATSGTTDEVFDPTLDHENNLTLRTLLTKHLDIKSIPRRSFFAKIAHFTEDEMQKERALEFTDPQYLDEYFDYATRPRRSILEVLQEFDTVKIPWQEAINIFPILRPRQFSIASGGFLKTDCQVFELLVAIVKYRTVIKRIREGVCTKYLATLPVGTVLNVTLHTEGRFHNTLTDIDRPHLLIGGGTGIAPLRSIIYEKTTIKNRPKSILIFGCRNAQSDFFFGKEWENMQDDASSTLRVIPAFSRDQATKVYVQDRLKENGPLVRDFLMNPRSIIVVCGSSGAMPKAVRQALQDIMSNPEESEANHNGTDDVITMLEKSGRFKQETW